MLQQTSQQFTAPTTANNPLNNFVLINCNGKRRWSLPIATKWIAEKGASGFDKGKVKMNKDFNPCNWVKRKFVRSQNEKHVGWAHIWVIENFHKY